MLSDKVLDDIFCVEPELEDQVRQFVAELYQLLDECESIVISFEQEDIVD